MEKKKTDGKKKGVASIPGNYVSILELQERWMREKKEGKHMGKGLVERGLKQEVDEEQRKREEEEKAMEPSVKLEDKNLGGGSRRPCGVKESLEREEPKCVEKEKLVVGENGGDLRQKRKKWSKKKKNEGGSKEEVVNFESKASQNPIWCVKTPNVVRDSVSVESQFQDRHDWTWSSTHVIKARKAMVWVAKGNKNHGAVGETEE